jgi:hypothetical protein
MVCISAVHLAARLNFAYFERVLVGSAVTGKSQHCSALLPPRPVALHQLSKCFASTCVSARQFCVVLELLCFGPPRGRVPGLVIAECAITSEHRYRGLLPDRAMASPAVLKTNLRVACQNLRRSRIAAELCDWRGPWQHWGSTRQYGGVWSAAVRGICWRVYIAYQKPEQLDRVHALSHRSNETRSCLGRVEIVIAGCGRL